ncbi:MAG: HEAT repeat domain-containing protein, partial [Chthoniobacteraceae bacterium]
HPEVLARGFENLVEIVFLPTGEIIGDDNWFQVLSAGVRDALVHLVEGGKYPRMPDNGSALPRTGGDLPALSKFPAVAFSGLMQYRGVQFPAAMRGSLFAAQFNARRVQRHVLTRVGSSFRSENIDFVTSDDPDFHPSDVLEAEDGSIIIIDTGAWYVQHCPTGRIRDSYAPGGVYRVRYKGATEKADDSVRRLEAQWTESSETLREKLLDANADVAALAARILGSRADRASGSQLAALLYLDGAPVRLAAAEALAHCGDAAALPAVWEALPAASDPFLEHALVFAALHLADERALRAALESPHPRVQKAALLLLDQPPHSALDPQTVMARLSTDDAELRGTALVILRDHVDWADQAVDYLRAALNQRTVSEAVWTQLRQLIFAFQAQPSTQVLIADSLTDLSLPAARRAMLVELLAQTELSEIPGPWIKALGQLLASDAPELRSAAVRTSASLQIPELDEHLAAIANDPNAPAALRLDALRGLVARHPEFPAFTLDFLREQLAPSHDAVTRLAVAQVLARATLNEAARGALRGIVGEDPLVAPLLFPVTSATNEQQRAQLAKYEPLLTGGDPARGRDVFASNVGCIICHRVGQEGGQIGPDLTKIGTVRSRRDLIESIVLPSATFAQGYEPYLVSTNDGLVIGGMVSRQSGETVFLRGPSGAEQRFPRKKIAKIERSNLSIMPPGLDLALSAEEFRDLLAYLESLH